jgi:uncharacterized protein YjbI with pentapeptide repeats
MPINIHMKPGVHITGNRCGRGVDFITTGREILLQIEQDSLAGVDVAGIDLAWADLHGADLRSASLIGCNLSMADLTGADLSFANCTGSNFTLAKLSNASLTCADFSSACLSGAFLDYSIMEGAVLSRAQLSYARWNAETKWPEEFPPSNNWVEAGNGLRKFKRLTKR